MHGRSSLNALSHPDSPFAEVGVSYAAILRMQHPQGPVTLAQRVTVPIASVATAPFVRMAGALSNEWQKEAETEIPGDIGRHTTHFGVLVFYCQYTICGVIEIGTNLYCHIFVVKRNSKE
jgi:hypothetical protein